MEKIQKQQLKNLTSDLRQIIQQYIDENKMSIHAFSKLTSVHPNQMYLFMNGQRGLNLTTVEKIAEIIS